MSYTAIRIQIGLFLFCPSYAVGENKNKLDM